MRVSRLTAAAAVALLAGALSLRIEAQHRIDERSAAARKPARVSRCELSIPIHVELVPLNQPELGRVAQFRVNVTSALDPDLVRNSWVEYELPERVRRVGGSPGLRDTMGKAITGRAELGIVVPDERRYEIRARYVVQLANGRTIAQTAVRHINIGNLPPEGMIGRVVDEDGNGIRVYRGTTVRN